MNNATDILTLENFWNEMKLKYPKSVQEWCDWIDAYKEKVGWGTYFKETKTPTVLRRGSMKAHELPIAFQVGMFIQYRYDKNFMPGFFDIHRDWKAQFESLFRHRELILSNREIEY